jgi:hypothetical protein
VEAAEEDDFAVAQHAQVHGFAGAFVERGHDGGEQFVQAAGSGFVDLAADVVQAAAEAVPAVFAFDEAVSGWRSSGPSCLLWVGTVRDGRELRVATR